MCFVCSLAKQHTVFKWKDAISGFPVSQSSAEALGRSGGKTKHSLISDFLNTSAKNYLIGIGYVKTIASQRWDVFKTQCTTQKTKAGFSRLLRHPARCFINLSLTYLLIDSPTYLQPRDPHGARFPSVFFLHVFWQKPLGWVTQVLQAG